MSFNSARSHHAVTSSHLTSYMSLFRSFEFHYVSHQEADQPDWRPEPEDVSYAEWVLDVTYYQRLEAFARRLAEAGVDKPHKLKSAKRDIAERWWQIPQEIGACLAFYDDCCHW